MMVMAMTVMWLMMTMTAMMKVMIVMLVMVMAMVVTIDEDGIMMMTMLLKCISSGQLIQIYRAPKICLNLLSK